MGRVRATYRTVAESPLLGLALAVCVVAGLGAAVAPGRLPYKHKAPEHWVTVPAVPGPLVLEAGREAKLVRASFDSRTAGRRVGLSAPVCSGRIEKVERREVRRCGLPEFGPLYRRPPPICS